MPLRALEGQRLDQPEDAGLGRYHCPRRLPAPSSSQARRACMMGFPRRARRAKGSETSRRAAGWRAARKLPISLARYASSMEAAKPRYTDQPHNGVATARTSTREGVRRFGELERRGSRAGVTRYTVGYVLVRAVATRRGGRDLSPDRLVRDRERAPACRPGPGRARRRRPAAGTSGWRRHRQSTAAAKQTRRAGRTPEMEGRGALDRRAVEPDERRRQALSHR
jgi:hypothetical protein